MADVCSHGVVGRVTSWATVLIVVAASQTALSQIVPDPEDTVYSTGAIFATEEELADKPRTPLYRNNLPRSVDLSHRFPPAGSQGKQGSCVGWAVGYAARSYYNSTPYGGRRLKAHQIPSPAYIYDTLRQPDTLCKRGTSIIAALDLLKKGVPSFFEYPYFEHLCRRSIPRLLSPFPRFWIAEWKVVDPKRLDQVKAELHGGHPVVISMRTNKAFHKLKRRRVWRAGAPRTGDGYHAVTVVGYSETGQYFTILNSWGQGWSHRGFGRIAYDTFRKRVRAGYSMRIEKKPAPPIRPPVPPKPKIVPPKPVFVPPKPKPAPPPPKVVPPPPKPAPPAPVVRELKLPKIECGRVAVQKRKGQTFVVGFVGTRDDLTKLEKAAALSKARIAVDLRPWPQCEALMTMEKPLSASSRPSISLPKSSYRASETLAFNVSMAGFQGYLHVAYIQADGNVVNLVRSDSLALSTSPAHTKMRFGDGRDGRSKFTVGAPFGNEMIVALASKSPLFDEDRPLVETEREFLTALRKAIIARPDPAQPERVVTASYVVLETIEGG